MRVAALILGLIAGVFALASPFVFKTNLMAPYLEHWAAMVDTRTAVLVWYALPVAAVLGALIAVVLPGFAALFLAAAAFGWAAIAFSTPELMHPGVLGAAGLAALAAISAQISGVENARAAQPNAAAARNRAAKPGRTTAMSAPRTAATGSAYQTRTAVRVSTIAAQCSR